MIQIRPEDVKRYLDLGAIEVIDISGQKFLLLGGQILVVSYALPGPDLERGPTDAIDFNQQ